MRARVSREHLLKSLQTVCPIIPARSTLPIISHILLEASKDFIRLSGTDLELGIISTAPAQVEEDGACAVPSKRFHDLIKELPNNPLQLSTKKNHQLSVESEGGLFKILGLPKEEFPHLPHNNDPNTLTIDQKLLKTMLHLTSFAASKDESRYALTGTLFITKGDWLCLVATDGRRLAVVERQAVNSSKAQHKVIVPNKTIEELCRLLGEGPTTKISIKENQIALNLGDTQIISQLINGQFPNYEQVIPPEVPEKLKVAKEPLLLATRRISLWTTQDSPSIRFDLKANHLTISKQTPEVGEAHEDLSVSYAGPEFSVGFNPTYLVDVLKALPDGDIELEVPGPDRPGVIRTKDHYIYIVLPMQLES